MKFSTLFSGGKGRSKHFSFSESTQRMLEKVFQEILKILIFQQSMLIPISLNENLLIHKKTVHEDLENALNKTFKFR